MLLMSLKLLLEDVSKPEDSIVVFMVGWLVGEAVKGGGADVRDRDVGGEVRVKRMRNERQVWKRSMDGE